MSKLRMFHGVDLRAHGVRINLSDLTVPEFGHFSLLVYKETLNNGLGEPIGIKEVIHELQTSIRKIVPALQNSTITKGTTLFVPDLWHITKGRCPLFPQHEAETLWNVQMFCLRIGRQFFNHEDVGFQHNYPGILFVYERGR